MTVVEVDASDIAAIVISGAINAILGAGTRQHVDWDLGAQGLELSSDVPDELGSEVLDEIDKSVAAASTVPNPAGIGILPFALRALRGSVSRGR